MSPTDTHLRALTLVRLPLAKGPVEPTTPPEGVRALLAETQLQRIDRARCGIRRVERVGDDPFPWLVLPLATVMVGVSREQSELVVDYCAELAARVLMLADETVVDDMLFDPDPRLQGALLEAEILAQVRAIDTTKATIYARLVDALGAFAELWRAQRDNDGAAPGELVEAALNVVAVATWIAVDARCPS